MNSHDRSNDSPGEHSRRDFIKLSALTGLGAALTGVGVSGCATPGRRLGPGPSVPFATAPLERVRIGFVGVGGMGTHHVRTFLRIEGVEIKAICDIREAHAKRAKAEPNNWGLAGDLGYVRQKTKELLTCLSAMRDEQIEEALAELRM